MKPVLRRIIPFSLIFILLVAYLILFFPPFACSEVTEVIAEGEYIMGDGETMSVAEERAQRNAARHAAEQAGAFVKSYTKVKNMVLRSDVIEVVANHSMKISVLKKQREMKGDAVIFYVRIKAVMSTEEIDENLKKLQNDQRAVDAYKMLQVDFDRLSKEMEVLKKQLTGAPAAERKTLLVKISNEEKLFKANLWMEEGQKYKFVFEKNDLQRGIDAYNKAIELNPDLVQAYIGRGNLFRQLYLLSPEKDVQSDAGRLDNALSDFTRAIEMDPKNPWAYYGRSDAIHFRGLDEIANDRTFIERTEKLNSTLRKSADEKRKLNELEINLLLKYIDDIHMADDKYLPRAFQDIDRALSLKSDEPSFYALRAQFYSRLDDCDFKLWLNSGSKASCDRAIIEITKAIALAGAVPGTDFPERLYITRSDYYRNNGNEGLAKRDREEFERLTKVEKGAPDVDEKSVQECKAKVEVLSKAISEDPDNPRNYLNRANELTKIGLYWSERGQVERAFDLWAECVKDMSSAIDLMEKIGAEKFGMELIYAYLGRISKSSIMQYSKFKQDNKHQYDREAKELSRIIELFNMLYREDVRKYKVASVEDMRKSVLLEEARLRKAGKKDEAEELNLAILILHTNYLKDSYINRAKIYEKLGLPGKAQADYGKACTGWEDEEACKAAKRLN